MQEEIIRTRWGTAIIDRSRAGRSGRECPTQEGTVSHLCPGDHEPAARPPGIYDVFIRRKYGEGKQ